MSRPSDIAWELGDGKTNPKIVEGVKVRLIYQTTADGMIINAGCEGVVIHALTPKVYKKKGTSLYFANCDMCIYGKTIRIRVPHGALEIL